MSLAPTGRTFVPTLKTKLFIRLYKLFAIWSQWFITHCDTEPFNLDDITMDDFEAIFLGNIEELVEIDE